MTGSTTEVYSLINLAHELAQYAESMEYCGEDQREQAHAIITEVERLTQLPNDWLVLRVVEASLVPKMIKLAKDIHLYRALVNQQMPKKERQKFRQRNTPELTHNSSAYDQFVRQAPPPPPTAEETIAIEQVLNDLYSLFELPRNP